MRGSDGADGAAGGTADGSADGADGRQFSLLIKPASADCNLRCAYCFYLSRAQLYPSTPTHRMSDQVLQRLISGYLSTDQRQFLFGWQGGEPALMGAGFFRRVTELQKKYGRAGAVVSNALQTNATLVDDELARHLAEYRFLVGASLDGPPALHDHYRKRAGGQGSHAEAIRGIGRLREHGVDFNILVLVNDINLKAAAQVYDYLCDNGWYYHQYIPCVEHDQQGRALPFSITGQQWGDFLCALFDRWVKADVGKVSVRLFDSIVNKLLGNADGLCHMGRDCRQYYVVEHNGEIYPCDFFVDKEYKLGDIQSGSWEQFHHSRQYRDFGARKSRWNQSCAACEYLALCAGDCPKHRCGDGGGGGGGESGGGADQLSVLCQGWKQFYRHALPGFRRIAGEVARERGRAMPAAPPAGAAPTVRKVGRNDPCPCGSGKKYKKCKCSQS